MTSSKRRDSVKLLQEQVQQLSSFIEGLPRAAVVEYDSEIEAHNGKEASKYEANQLLASRLVHGFDERDGPVLCILGKKCRNESTCHLGNGHNCYVKHSWIQDLFNSHPEFIHMPTTVSVDDILAASPSIVVTYEDFPLPRKIPGYIRVRLRAFRFQMLFKIKE